MAEVVQGLWIGSGLSPMEVLCIRSFQHHGHPFHLYSYGPLENVPDGAIVKDANEILTESEVFWKRGGDITGFSDFFRWELLKRRGGIWVDMDAICLKPLEFDDEVVMAWDGSGSVGTSVLKFPAGHPLAGSVADACRDVNAIQPFDTPRAMVKKLARRIAFGREKSRIYTRHTEPGGPGYVTKFVQQHGLIGAVKPSDWFYPILWDDWHSAFEISANNLEILTENSYVIHLWNNMFRNDPDIDKNDLRLSGTLLGSLCQRYL